MSEKMTNEMMSKMEMSVPETEPAVINDDHGGYSKLKHLTSLVWQELNERTMA